MQRGEDMAAWDGREKNLVGWTETEKRNAKKTTLEGKRRRGRVLSARFVGNSSSSTRARIALAQIT